MAARFGGVTKSENGNTYIAAIFDEDFVGTAGTMVVQNIEISVQNEGRSRFAPIFGTSAVIRILIDSTALETMITDIVAAEEGRFTLRILKGLELYFVGYILADLITIENSKKEINYVFEIQATDAVGRMKSIEYSDSGSPYSGYATFIEHIFIALNKQPGITGLYSGDFQNDYILKVICNWHEDSYTYASTINPLKQSRIGHRAFYSRDSKGNNKFLSCYDVIKSICEAWGMRFMFSDGAFWLIQVNECYTSPSSLTVFEYEADQTENVNSSFDMRVTHKQSTPTTTGIVELSGGSFKFLAPLKKFKVRYQHFQTRNLIAGYVANNASQPTQTDDDVSSNGGVGRLAYEGISTISAIVVVGPDPAATVRLLFRYTIQVGTYYLKRVVSFAAGGYSYDYINGDWVNVSATFDYVIAYPGPLLYSGPPISVDPLGFLSEVLAEDGDLSFSVNYIQAYDANGNTVADISVTWEISNNYMELLHDGAFSEQNDIIEYSASNDETTNSEEVEVMTRIGDGSSISSPGHIEVLNDAVAWVESDAWRVGNSGAYDAHSQLLVNEVIKGRLKPVRRKLCTFYNVTEVLQPHNVVNDDVNKTGYLLTGGTWNLGRDEISGEWFNLQSDTHYTENASVEQPADSPNVTSPSGTGNPGGGITTVVQGSGSTTKVYTEEFTSVVADTVTITENGGNLPANESAILVYWNGQWTNQYTITGSDIAFDFTVDSSDYINVIFFIS